MAKIRKQLVIGYGGEPNVYSVIIGKKDLPVLTRKKVGGTKASLLRIDRVECKAYGSAMSRTKEGDLDVRVEMIERASVLDAKENVVETLKDVSVSWIEDHYDLPKRMVEEGYIIHLILDSACEKAIRAAAEEREKNVEKPWYVAYPHQIHEIITMVKTECGIDIDGEVAIKIGDEIMRTAKRKTDAIYHVTTERLCKLARKYKPAKGRGKESPGDMPTDRSKLPTVRQRFENDPRTIYQWYKNMIIPSWFDKMYDRALKRMWFDVKPEDIEHIKKMVDKREAFALAMMKEPGLEQYFDPESIIEREIKKTKQGDEIEKYFKERDLKERQARSLRTKNVEPTMKLIYSLRDQVKDKLGLMITDAEASRIIRRLREDSGVSTPRGVVFDMSYDRLKKLVEGARVAESRIDPKTRKLLNNLVYEYVGKQNYHDDIPVKKIDRALAEAGYMLADPEAIFVGEDGRDTFDIMRKADRSIITNSLLVLSWHKMPSGKFEITVYVS